MNYVMEKYLHLVRNTFFIPVKNKMVFLLKKVIPMVKCIVLLYHQIMNTLMKIKFGNYYLIIKVNQ